MTRRYSLRVDTRLDPSGCSIRQYPVNRIQALQPEIQVYLSGLQMDDLTGVFFATPEGSSVDDVALPPDRDDSTAEQKVALILVVAFVCHFAVLLFTICGALVSVLVSAAEQEAVHE